MELKEQAYIVRLMVGYLAGQLNVEEQKQLDDWVNRSERNRAYFRKWCDEEQQDRLLEKISAYDVSRGWEAVIRKRQGWKRLRWAIAAAGIILLIGGLGILRYGHRSGTAPLILAPETRIEPGKRLARLITASGDAVRLDTLRQIELDNLSIRREQGSFLLKTAGPTTEKTPSRYHCVEVPAGGEFGFQLPDGTEVFLNAGSRLRFPEYFVPGEERRVYLSGEAYFDVARDTTSPFLVSLKHTVVKVLGTSFNVTAYPEEEREVATLVRGAVALEQTATGEKVTLTPGQQGSYDILRKSLTKQQVDVSYYTSWKDGVFAFDKQPLEQVIKILSRWYLFDIDYADPALHSILYTGKVARHASIREVLHTFELLDELRFEVRGRKIIVSRK